MAYRIIGNEKERAAEWAWQHFPDQWERPYWGEYTALIHQWGDDIRAVVIYNSFHMGVSCDFHVASAPNQRWITRSFLIEVFSYPFIELGMLRLNAKVAATNTRIIRLIEHLGFVREGIHPKAWDGKTALHSYGMLKEHCRYLEMPFLCTQETLSRASQRKFWASPTAGACFGWPPVTARAMGDSEYAQTKKF